MSTAGWHKTWNPAVAVVKVVGLETLLRNVAQIYGNPIRQAKRFEVDNLEHLFYDKRAVGYSSWILAALHGSLTSANFDEMMGTLFVPRNLKIK
jgi:hypothetical protein